MEESRLELIQAVENADKNLTEQEKSALADDLLPRLKGWKQ